MADNKLIDELLKQARVADKEDRELAEALERLVKNPDWSVYIKIISKKQQFFADEMLRPSGSVDGCIRQEYIKGALSGLVMAADTPSVIIAATKELRQAKESDDAP